MRISRFYLPSDYQVGQTLTLSKEQAHYAITVLRLKDNRVMEVFNGKGNQALATLKHTSRRTADILITEVSNPDTESPLHTILLQGISKGDRMDYTIQKCVELGINEIRPLITQHCDVKLNEQKLVKLREHWQNIAISACEQSNRNVVPIVHPAQTYTDWLGEQDTAVAGLVLNPYAKAGLKAAPSQLAEQAIHLLIGPEGGLSDEEVKQAVQQGLTDIQLGKRILRTETAGVAVLSALQFHWGDF